MLSIYLPVFQVRLESEAGALADAPWVQLLGSGLECLRIKGVDQTTGSGFMVPQVVHKCDGD